MMKLYLTAIITLIPFIALGMEGPSLEILLSIKGPFKLTQQSFKEKPSIVITKEGKNVLPIQLTGYTAQYNNKCFILPIFTQSDQTNATYTLYFYQNKKKLKVNLQPSPNDTFTAVNFHKKTKKATLTLNLCKKGKITSIYFDTKTKKILNPKSKEKKIWVEVEEETEKALLRRLLGDLLDDLDEEPYKDLGSFWSYEIN